MPERRRSLTLLAAALVLVPAGRAGGQAVADHAPVPRSEATAVTSDSASLLLARSLQAPVPALALSAVAVPAHEREFVPLSTSRTRRERSSLGRSTAWGAVIGAAAGTATGLTVLAMCDSYCDGVEAGGVLAHIGVGTVVGGGIGALVHWLRR